MSGVVRGDLEFEHAVLSPCRYSFSNYILILAVASLYHLACMDICHSFNHILSVSAFFFLSRPYPLCAFDHLFLLDAYFFFTSHSPDTSIPHLAHDPNLGPAPTLTLSRHP